MRIVHTQVVGLAIDAPCRKLSLLSVKLYDDHFGVLEF